MSIPFTIPADVVAQAAAGVFRREGAFIRDVASGQIVRVLQETGAVDALMMANPGGAAVKLVGTAATIVQNQQIKAGIATLQALGLANLALGAASLGVSVAGFAVPSAKLRRVEDQVRAVGDRLDRLAKVADDLQRQAIRDDLSDLTTACEQADEAWSLASPDAQWAQAGGALHRLQNRFLNRARVTRAEGARLEVMDPLVDALTLAGSVRVSARLATGDEGVAREAAGELAHQVLALTSDVGAASLLRQSLEDDDVPPTSPHYRARVEAGRGEAGRVADAVRDREQRVAALPILLGALQAQGVHGRDWLTAAREADEPLLSLEL